MLYKHICEGCLNMLKCLNHIRFSSIPCRPWVAPRPHINACFLLVLQAFQAFGGPRTGKCPNACFLLVLQAYSRSPCKSGNACFLLPLQAFLIDFKRTRAGQKCLFSIGFTSILLLYLSAARPVGWPAGRLSGWRAGRPAAGRPAGAPRAVLGLVSEGNACNGNDFQAFLWCHDSISGGPECLILLRFTSISVKSCLRRRRA